MITNPVEIPDLKKLSDTELMSLSPQEFAEKMIARAELLGETFFHIDNWRMLELDEETKRKGLAEFCIRLAWREFYNGVHPPAKQIVMLEELNDDIGIRIRLAQQIIDEVSHQRIWSEWTKHYGGNPRIQDYKADADISKTFEINTANTDPAEIAAALQCTGEPLLTYLFGLGSTLEPKNSITYTLLPDDLLLDIEKRVVAEEPRHIAVGRDIMAKYCGDAAKRRRVLQVQTNKMNNAISKFIVDLRLLGAERITPLPIVT